MSYPDTLEFQPWLEWALGSPHEETRIFALLELKRVGGIEAFAEKLAELSRRDSSPFCCDLARELLELQRLQREGLTLSGSQELSPWALKNLLEASPPALFQALVESIRKPPPEAVLDLWRHNIVSENHPVLQEIGLSLLARFGKAADSSFALSFLESRYSGVLIAALDLLHAQNPDLFRTQGMVALENSDINVVAHVIRRLGTIAPADAVLALEPLTVSDDLLVRQKAVPELILLPFELTRGAVLRRLALESFPLLIITLGIAISTNPAPDLPEKLYEILMHAEEEKKPLLQTIFKNLLISIKAAGILREPEAAYFSRLKDRLQARKAETRRHLLLADLDSGNTETQFNAVQELSFVLDQPGVTEALASLEARDPEAGIRDAIGQLLRPQPVGVSLSRLDQEIAENTLLSQPVAVQKELVQSITDRAMLCELRGRLRSLPFGSLEKPVLFEVLKCFERWGTQADAPFLTCLFDSPAPAILAPAIRTIGTLDHRQLQSRLPRFLSHSDVRVQKAALEVYVRENKFAAIGHIERLLESPDLLKRKSGISLLSLLDYPSASGLISKAVRREKEESLRQSLGILLASNPCEEALYDLFLLTHSSDGALLGAQKALWFGALENAEKVMEISRDHLQTKARNHWQLERAPRAPVAPVLGYRIQTKTHEQLIADLRVSREVELVKTREYFTILLKTIFWLVLLVGFPVWYYHRHIVGAPRPDLAGTPTATGTRAPAVSHPPKPALDDEDAFRRNKYMDSMKKLLKGEVKNEEYKKGNE
jgi:hypothetical protein